MNRQKTQLNSAGKAQFLWVFDILSSSDSVELSSVEFVTTNTRKTPLISTQLEWLSKAVLELVCEVKFLALALALRVKSLLTTLSDSHWTNGSMLRLEISRAKHCKHYSTNMRHFTKKESCCGNCINYSVKLHKEKNLRRTCRRNPFHMRH